MKFIDFASFLAAPLHVSAVQSAAPSPPTFTHLYSMNCTVAAGLTIGDGPIYNRVALPIVGGTFTGPRINGTIANLGADWGITDKKGVFHPDTRYHLITDDGAGIFVQTTGPSQADGRIQLRIVFETGSEKYYWLNYVVAVGILKAVSGGVQIDAWQVSTGKVLPPVGTDDN